MNLFLLPDSSNASRQAGKGWDKFASSLGGLWVCLGLMCPVMYRLQRLQPLKRRNHRGNWKDWNWWFVAIGSGNGPWLVAGRKVKKNKESKRSAKRDLVKCFYDDAIWPAGDVPLRFGQLFLWWCNLACRWCSREWSFRAGQRASGQLHHVWLGKKECCPTVGFVHRCFKFLL